MKQSKLKSTKSEFTHTIIIRVTAAMHRKLKILSANTGKSISVLARRLFKDLLRNKKEGEND